jgi:hypothetical protein
MLRPPLAGPQSACQDARGLPCFAEFRAAYIFFSIGWGVDVPVNGSVNVGEHW